MKKFNHLRAGVAPVVLGLAMLSTPVFAQDESQDQNATDVADESTESVIIVTGSRILRPNIDAASPVTTVLKDELLAGGDLNLGDAISDLPTFRSTFSQSNSTRFIGTAGLSLLDLRGLGTNRTLVLVNGRRHITSQPGVPTSVDVNTIPSALIERVDVVTGGTSAVYGADAVAGVVNFILKRDFEGLEGQVQGGIADHGGRGSFSASVTAGKNFADGRGNIAVSTEYSRQQALYHIDRDDLTGAYSGRRQLQLTQNTIGEDAGGDGVPDRTFQVGVFNNNISEGGLYTSSCPDDIPANAARRAVNCSGDFSNTGAELGSTFVFLPNGQLVRNPVITDFRSVGSGNALGGLGSSLLLTRQLVPQIERKAANLLASFEISQAFRPFVEAKFVRIDAIQSGQPTFNFNTFSIDNPFLSASSRALLQSSLEPGATSFSAFRFNVDFGGRGEDHSRELYRIVAGVDGEFNDDWRYEVAFNYGKLKTFYSTQGNTISANYANAIDAQTDGAGNIVCGINNDADPTNDDPACVPVNLFGFGAPSQAALDYFTYTSTRKQSADQIALTAFMSGDLSGLFELPGGPIAFAVGGEYRQEGAYSAFDAFTQSGATFLNAIPTFDPPDLKVYEAYGEVRIPLLADMPFAHELTIEAAGRVSDYNLGGTGTAYTYNLGGIYSPIPGLRIRGGYARSVRAPTQDDLLSSPSQTFLNGLVDPCASNNINDNPNRVTNCAADGVPTTELVNGVSVPFTNQPASGIRGLSGSNPNLNEEVSDSFTIGAVFQPDFLPGLSLTVDYYNITVKDVIFSLAPQTIIDQCYDSPSGINNQYCDAVFRRADGTFQGQSDRLVGGNTVSYTVGPNDSSFLSGPFNFARQKTSGIDADLNYTHDFGGVVVNARGLVSYIINRDNYTDIDDPSFIDQQLLELGDPEWAGQFSLSADFGAPRVTWTMRYIGPQFVDSFETFNSLQGRDPENPDYSDPIKYSETFYHNIRFDLDVSENFTFYGGIDNVFDTDPPLGLDGITEGSGQYDNIGRYLFMGAKFRM